MRIWTHQPLRALTCSLGLSLSLGIGMGLTHTSVSAQTSTTVIQPTNVQAECLFRWAEDQHPAYFRPSKPDTQSPSGFTYRYYSKTNTYLGVSKTDGNLYLYAPDTGNKNPINLGSASDWVAKVGCTNPYAPVTTAFDDVPVAAICDPQDPAQNCVETHAKAVRIDDEVRFAFERTEFDTATNTFKAQLKQGASLDPRLEVGTFIYRSRKDRTPLLHRIDSLKQEGQLVTMTISKAKAKEVFPRMRIRTRIPLSDANTSASTSTSKSLRESPQEVSVGIGPKDCSGKVFNAKAASGGITGSATLDLTTCRFRLTAWADLVLEWDNALTVNLDRFEVVVGGGVDAALHSTLQLDLSGKYSDSARIWEGPEIPFTVGPVLLTINPAMYAGYDLAAKATLTSQQGFDLTDSIEVGFAYSDAKDWYSIDKRSSSFSAYGPNVTFDGNVTANAWIKPELALKAYGILGGTISLQGFAEAKLTSTASVLNGQYTGNLCASLDLGLSPRVGGIIEALGITLFSEDLALATVRTNLVKNKCQPYTGPVPTDADPSRSSCFNDGQCAQPTEPGLTVKCEKGAQTSNGLYIYACQTKYPNNYCLAGSSAAGNTLCNDNSIYTTDSCNAQTSRCENIFRNGDLATAAAVILGKNTSATAGNVFSSCTAPDCCTRDSDCDDGDTGTLNICDRPKGGLPTAKGTCTTLKSSFIVK